MRIPMVRTRTCLFREISGVTPSRCRCDSHF